MYGFCPASASRHCKALTVIYYIIRGGRFMRFDPISGQTFRLIGCLGTMLGEASHRGEYYDRRQIQDNMTRIEMAPLGQDEVHVRIASLDHRQSELRFFESILAKDEIERANRFRFQKDRERFVAGRGLLRMILSSYVGVPPGEIIFTYGSHGKPGLRRQDGRTGD